MLGFAPIASFPLATTTAAGGVVPVVVAVVEWLIRARRRGTR